MDLKTKYALATVFWIMTLIWGWQLSQVKSRHWLMFAGWIIIMTIGYIWILKEFKARGK